MRKLHHWPSIAATKPLWWWGTLAHWIVFMTSLYMYYALYACWGQSVCHEPISVLINIIYIYIHTYIYIYIYIYINFVCHLQKCQYIYIKNEKFISKPVIFWFLPNLWRLNVPNLRSFGRNRNKSFRNKCPIFDIYTYFCIYIMS